MDKRMKRETRKPVVRITFNGVPISEAELERAVVEGGRKGTGQ
jgi:hypothetical protein